MPLTMNAITIVYDWVYVWIKNEEARWCPSEFSCPMSDSPLPPARIIVVLPHILQIINQEMRVQGNQRVRI